MTKPLPETLNYLIARMCHTHRRRASQILAAFDLHPGQEMLLVQLWLEDGLSQSVLADRLGGQLPTVTRMLQRLEARGLLVVRSSEEDGRVSHAFLTEEGKALQAHVEAAWATFEDQTLSGFTLEEHVLLRRLLLHLYGNLLE